MASTEEAGAATLPPINPADISAEKNIGEGEDLTATKCRYLGDSAILLTPTKEDNHPILLQRIKDLATIENIISGEGLGRSMRIYGRVAGNGGMIVEELESAQTLADTKEEVSPTQDLERNLIPFSTRKEILLKLLKIGHLLDEEGYVLYDPKPDSFALKEGEIVFMDPGITKREGYINMAPADSVSILGNWSRGDLAAILSPLKNTEGSVHDYLKSLDLRTHLDGLSSQEAYATAKRLLEEQEAAPVLESKRKGAIREWLEGGNEHVVTFIQSAECVHQDITNQSFIEQMTEVSGQSIDEIPPHRDMTRIRTSGKILYKATRDTPKGTLHFYRFKSRGDRFPEVALAMNPKPSKAALTDLGIIDEEILAVVYIEVDNKNYIGALNKFGEIIQTRTPQSNNLQRALTQRK